MYICIVYIAFLTLDSPFPFRFPNSSGESSRHTGLTIIFGISKLTIAEFGTFGVNAGLRLFGHFGGVYLSDKNTPYKPSPYLKFYIEEITLTCFVSSLLVVKRHIVAETSIACKQDQDHTKKTINVRMLFSSFLPCFSPDSFSYRGSYFQRQNHFGRLDIKAWQFCSWQLHC